MSEIVERRIADISPIIVSKAKEYGYKYPSAIIAQALAEGSGTYQGGIWSHIATVAYNFFGMKAGPSWKGDTIQTDTGVYRKYSSKSAGIDGYFDFISTDRYSNLKEVTSSKDYLITIGHDGWNPNPDYGLNIYNAFVVPYNLESRFDGDEPTPPTPGKITEIIILAAIKCLKDRKAI